MAVVPESVPVPPASGGHSADMEKAVQLLSAAMNQIQDPAVLELLAEVQALIQPLPQGLDPMAELMNTQVSI